jgi:hypothetical protein
MRGAGDAALNDGNPEVGGRQVDISGRWFDGQAAVQRLCRHHPAGQAVRGQAVPESASQKCLSLFLSHKAYIIKTKYFTNKSHLNRKFIFFQPI